MERLSKNKRGEERKKGEKSAFISYASLTLVAENQDLTFLSLPLVTMVFVRPLPPAIDCLSLRPGWRQRESPGKTPKAGNSAVYPLFFFEFSPVQHSKKCIDIEFIHPYPLLDRFPPPFASFTLLSATTVESIALRKKKKKIIVGDLSMGLYFTCCNVPFQ